MALRLLCRLIRWCHVDRSFRRARLIVRRVSREYQSAKSRETRAILFTERAGCRENWDPSQWMASYRGLGRWADGWPLQRQYPATTSISQSESKSSEQD